MINPAAIEPVDLPYIDEMPKFRRIELAELVASAVKARMARPGAEEDFQRWKAEREKRRKENHEQAEKAEALDQGPEDRPGGPRV